MCPQVKVTGGHVVTQVYHVAYQSMRLDERNTLGPTALLYLYSIKSYRQKMRLTSNDLKRPEGEVIVPNLHMDHRKCSEICQT